MSKKDDLDDLFGGLSDSDSSEANEENNNNNPSSVFRDLEMSSDDENIQQEECQTVERMEYQYPKIASSASEGGYSTISSVTTSVSSSSYEDVQDVEMYENVALDDRSNVMEKMPMHSPGPKTACAEYVLDTTDNVSTQNHFYKTLQRAPEDSDPTWGGIQQSSVIKAQPPVLKPSMSWNRRNVLSGGHPSFNDEEQKDVTESKKAEQTVSNKLLIGNFSNEQLDRYIAFRRSKFTRQAVKNVISEVTGKTTSDPIAVAIAGLAKLFVGEIVEEAVELRDALNEQNKPVQPQHIKSAFNKLVNEGKLWPPYGKKY